MGRIRIRHADTKETQNKEREENHKEESGNLLQYLTTITSYRAGKYQKSEIESRPYTGGKKRRGGRTRSITSH